MQKLLATLFILFACAIQAQNIVLSPNGVATVKGQQAITAIHLVLWDQQWKHASIQAGGQPDESIILAKGILGIPDSDGAYLDYTITKKAFPDKQTLDYRVAPSKSTTIQGAFINTYLDLQYIANREFVMVPNGHKGTFPEKLTDANVYGSNATGVAIKQDDGNYLLINSGKNARLLIQDNRAFNVESMEIRFIMTPGKINKGLNYANKLTVSTITPQKLQAMTAKIKQDNMNASNKLVLSFDDNGRGALHRGSTNFASMQLAVHGIGWTYADQQGGSFDSLEDENTRSFVGSIIIPGTDETPLLIEQTLKPMDNILKTDYRLEIPKQVKMNGYQLSYNLNLSHYIDAKLTLAAKDGNKTFIIPAELKASHAYNGEITSINVKPTSANIPEITISMDQPTNILLQDGRGWGGNSYELRFNFMRAEQGDFQGPSVVNRTFTFTAKDDSGEVTIFPNLNGINSVTDTTGWFPYTLPWDAESPLNVDFLNHKPAGKFGFIACKDGNFITTGNGEPIRFWGTCFSAGANFPTHEQARLIAKRLASYGINMVRTHHADASWAENHFFPRDKDNTREFDPVNLDKFDYLIYCLKQEGIYIYLDQLVNRKFKAGDGVDAADKLPTCAKPYCYFDRKLIELQKEFSSNLWNHVNPYTKLAYKDDPAIAMMEFANENDLFTQSVTLEPYRTRFEALYRDWAKKNNITLPQEKIDFTILTDPMQAFFVHVTDEYHREMGDFLRNQVGVKVPMTGSNWTRSAALLLTLSKLDFTDSHTYWNHPGKGGIFGTNSMLRSTSTVFNGLGFQKLKGLPFFVSEWDAPWPYEYRAELPAWMAATAAFQDWNGLTVYTYRHSSVPIDYINGAFETFNDPARFGLFPISALIYRKGLVTPGKTVKTINLSSSEAQTAKAPGPWSIPACRNNLAGLYRFQCEFDSKEPDALDKDSKPIQTSKKYISENEQIIQDIDNSTVIVNTPAAQVVSSFFDKQDTVSTDNVTVKVNNQFATIAVASPTDDPIQTSNRLFLTIVGRAENTDFAYSFLRNKRTNTGKGPILVDKINATITIKTANNNLNVYPMTNTGEKLPPLKVTRTPGQMAFETTANTIHYILE